MNNVTVTSGGRMWLCKYDRVWFPQNAENSELDCSRIKFQSRTPACAITPTSCAWAFTV